MKLTRESRGNGVTMFNLSVFPPSIGGMVASAVWEAHQQGKLPSIEIKVICPLVISMFVPTGEVEEVLKKIKSILRANPSTSKLEIEEGSKSG